MGIRTRSLAGGLTGVVLLGAAVLTTGASAGQSAREITGTEVFAKGEGGYNCFRIPAVVRTQDRNTLLAFAEGRHNDCDDTGDIDIVLKRSTNDGKDWGGIELVADGAGDTRGNPVPIVDRESGRITLLSTHNPGPECSETSDKCTRTPYLQHSTSPDGKGWTDPAKQTQLTKKEWNTWYATGPGHGLQLTQGEHRNRMVAGINFEGDNARGAGLAYSDDGGTTWKLGATSDDTGTELKPQELNLLETVDGDIYTAARNNYGNDDTDSTGNRADAISKDAGGSFDGPFALVPELRGPKVQGSVVRLRATSAGDPNNLILFSGPYNPDTDMAHRRHTMRIRTSTDEGASWQETGTVVDATWAGYSDLINLGGGWAGILYEAGPEDARDTIRYARFSEGDLN